MKNFKIGYSSIPSMPQIEISDENNIRIANLPLPKRSMGKSTNKEIDEMQEANAQLFSLAPNTLKALIEFFRTIGSVSFNFTRIIYCLS